MGVKGLWRLLMPVGRRISIETLEGKILAVDASIWLTQFITAMRDPESGSVRPAAHIIGFFRRLCRLRFHGIRPVFVFDGATPEIKKREIQQRRKRREQFATTHGTSMIQRMAKQILVQQLKKQKIGNVSSASASGETNNNSNAAFAPGFRPLEIVEAEAKDNETTQNDEVKQKENGKKEEKPAGQQGTIYLTREETGTAEIPETNDTEDNGMLPHHENNNDDNEVAVVDLDNDWDKPILLDDDEPSPQNQKSSSSSSSEYEDSDGDSSGSSDSDIESHNDDNDAAIMNPDHISSLPPDERKDAIEDAKRMQRMRSRKEFMPVAAKPADYSQVQLRNFLRSSRLNQSIAKMATKAAQKDNKGKIGEVMASDRTRRVLFEKDVVRNNYNKRRRNKTPFAWKNNSMVKKKKPKKRKSKRKKRSRVSKQRRVLASSSDEEDSGDDVFAKLENQGCERSESQTHGNAAVAADSTGALSDDSEASEGGGFITRDDSRETTQAKEPATSRNHNADSDDSSEGGGSGGGFILQTASNMPSNNNNNNNNMDTSAAAQELEDSMLARAIQDSVDEGQQQQQEQQPTLNGSGTKQNNGDAKKNIPAFDWGDDNNEWNQRQEVVGGGENAAALEQAEATASNLTNWAGRAVRRAIAQHKEDTGQRGVGAVVVSNMGRQSTNKKGGGESKSSSSSSSVIDLTRKSVQNTTSLNLENHNEKKQAAISTHDLISRDAAYAQELADNILAEAIQEDDVEEPPSWNESKHDKNLKDDNFKIVSTQNMNNINNPVVCEDSQEEDEVDWESGDGMTGDQTGKSQMTITNATYKDADANKEAKEEDDDAKNIVSQSQEEWTNDLKESIKGAEQICGKDSSGEEEDEDIDWESGDEMGNDNGEIASDNFTSTNDSNKKEEIPTESLYVVKGKPNENATSRFHGSPGVLVTTHKSKARPQESAIPGKTNSVVVRKLGVLDTEHSHLGDVHGSTVEARELTKEEIPGIDSEDDNVDWENCDDVDHDEGKHKEVNGDHESKSNFVRQVNNNGGYNPKSVDPCHSNGIQMDTNDTYSETEIPRIDSKDEEVDWENGDDMDNEEYMCTTKTRDQSTRKDGTTAAALKQAEDTASNLTNWAGRAVRRAIAEHIENSDISKEPRRQKKQDEATTSPYFNDSSSSPAIEADTEANHSGEMLQFSSANMEQTVGTLEEDLHEQQSEGRSLEREVDTVTDEMRAEAMQLLQLFGVPYVQAPAEAEAQCVTLEKLGLVNGIVTEDSDAFVFGGKTIYKNIFDDQKYVEVYRADDAERELGLGTNEMVALAMLLGGDYTAGIKGVGIVNGMEILETFDVSRDLKAGLTKFRTWLDGFDPAEAVLGQDTTRNNSTELLTREKVFHLKHKSARTRWNAPDNFPADYVITAYTNPVVDTSRDRFSWGIPDMENIVTFCNRHIGWRAEDTQALLEPVIKKVESGSRQTRIDSFMTYEQGIKFASVRSKRLREVFTAAQSGAVRGKKKRSGNAK